MVASAAMVDGAHPSSGSRSPGATILCVCTQTIYLLRSISLATMFWTHNVVDPDYGKTNQQF